MNFKIISNIVSNSFFISKLLPFYEKICFDSDWTVREASTLIIIDVMKLW